VFFRYARSLWLAIDFLVSRADNRRMRRNRPHLNGAAVAVQDLRHRYGDRQALAGITFAVREGEMFGLPRPERQREEHAAPHPVDAAAARGRKPRASSARRRGGARPGPPRARGRLSSRRASTGSSPSRRTSPAIASLYGIVGAGARRQARDHARAARHRGTARRAGRAAVGRPRAARRAGEGAADRPPPRAAARRASTALDPGARRDFLAICASYGTRPA
jgi:hypothetical protein